MATICNCTICAKEFDLGEVLNPKLNSINYTKYKICEACLSNSNPEEDYKEVKDIIEFYKNSSEAQKSFDEAIDILKDIL